MAYSIKQLSAHNLHKLSGGMHSDGGGLYLQVKNGGRSWIYRFMLAGRPRYMGLGTYPSVTLSDARKHANTALRMVREGRDPIEVRKQLREAQRIGAAHSVTFASCAEEYIKSYSAGWRNARHGAQWRATLQKYAYPVFGHVPVSAINADLVIKTLNPIWNTKTETASRVRQRIERVLDWATAHGHRRGENPARWRGHLENVFQKRSKVQPVNHFDALHYTKVRMLIEELASRNAISSYALAFTILTAARSGETRGATFSEIDFDNAVWIVPGIRTKSGREHRVPLTRETMKLIGALPHFATAKGGDFLFPGLNGHMMSDATMRKFLQEDLGYSNITVHGFRSTFRVWAAEQTNFPRELAEAALGHVIGDKTEAAYQRSDLLGPRRKLMEAWAQFCTTSPIARNEVVAFRQISNT